jgi:hypothetical protein
MSSTSVLTLLMAAPTVHFITSQHGPHRKHRSSIAESNCCLADRAKAPFLYCCLQTVVQSPISRSQLSNGSTCHNILFSVSRISIWSLFSWFSHHKFCKHLLLTSSVFHAIAVCNNSCIATRESTTRPLLNKCQK